MSYFAPSAVVSQSRTGDLAEGDVVGHWRVEGELGRGGMGTVYAVVHAAIGKRAALKVIHHSALTIDYTAERFLTEARAVNAVGHPNIVDIFESGTLPDGRPYLVMERLHGKTLGDRQDEGRVPALEIIDYLVPLCDALAAAHAAGIVHRDIKLDNVFLCDASATQLGLGGGPIVKLLDWGIASMVNVDGERSYGNLMVGTPRYVAPEQARGERVTTASDVYSLGVVAYELFLEEPPFNAPSAAELLVLHLTEPPPLPHEVWPQIPQALEDLLLAMLAKTPALRPTVTQVAEALIDLRKELRRATSVPPVVAISDEPSAPRASGGALVRVPTPVSIGHEPTQLEPLTPTPAPARSSGPSTESALQAMRPPWRSWRGLAGVGIVVALLAVRMMLSDRSPRTAAAEDAPAAPIAVTTPPIAELAPEPGPIELRPASAAAPAAAPAPTAVVRRATHKPATAATANPAPSARPAAAAARPMPPKAVRGRLHPDAVIDPY